MDDFLNVYLNNKHVGILEKDGNGGINFKYLENVDKAISLSLPIQEYPFDNKQCCGFFNGLLPESEHTRIAIGKKYGINSKNDFSMLQVIGYDCAGAVSFWDNNINASEYLKESYNLEYTTLTSEELENYIKELPRKPLATGIKDMRLSLAGAQDKTAVVVNDNKIGIPKNNVPTTHILKPTIEGLNESIENEYICIKAAEKIGIMVPKVQIGYANKIKYFLIERYDRVVNNNKIVRIHQEDFCQASNIVSAYKYQAEGGVDFNRCFEILRNTSQPAKAIKQFIYLMVFNYLIGNNDAHGKNFSILHNDNGTKTLAPAYDILCTQIYPELSKKMAMKIGGHYEHDIILPRHFEKLANAVDISYTQLKKIIKEQCNILPDIIDETINSFDNNIGKDIYEIVVKNCRKLSSNF